MAAQSDSAITTAMLSTTIVFTVVATVAVGLRVYVWKRIQSNDSFTSDLWLIIASLVFCWATMLQTIIAGGIAGVDHTHYDQRTATVFFRRVFWTDLFFIQPASGLVKLSVLQFYKRIFVFQWFRRVCNVQGLLVIIWVLGSLLGRILTANPVNAAWAVTSERVVINVRQYYGGIFGACIALDFITLCLPLPVISRLQQSRRNKWKIVGIFWLGSFCVVAASVRLYYAMEGFKPHPPGTRDLAPYRITAQTGIWSRIEPTASVIAACLPLYGPLLPKGKSLATFVQSAIELFSLRSRSSGRSGRSARTNENTSVQHGAAAGSTQAINLQEKNSTEAASYVHSDEVDLAEQGRGKSSSGKSA